MADILSYFFPGDCYEEVVEKLNFFDARCLKLFNSRFLSLQIILGSMLVKLPQIIKCVRAHSVENLSYLSFLLELAAVTFSCSYGLAKGFPFSAWGEGFFISIQVVILLGLMFYYNNQMIYMAIFAPAYGAVVWYLTSDLVAMEMLSTLQASVIPIMIASRLTQVVTTFMNKTTGQLSFITSFLNVAGTAARVFTTIQETQDTLLLINFSVAFVLNSIILFQFFLYWNAPTEADKEKRKKAS